MARLRGRSRRGTRCRMPVPHGHWKTTTFIGGLRLSGMTAPMMLDSPMTGEWFATYVRKVLAPTLSPGDVVILENLPAHKGAEAREAVEAVGARLLFLPPYSPDLNPIENIFAKMKAWIRRVGPEPLMPSKTRCAAQSTTSVTVKPPPALLPPDMNQIDRIML